MARSVDGPGVVGRAAAEPTAVSKAAAPAGQTPSRSPIDQTAGVRPDTVIASPVEPIALEHGLNANLLFKWRRNALCAQVNSEPAVLLPVQLKPELLSSQVIAAVPHPPAEDQSSRSTGSIELEVAGALVRLQGDVNEANLRSVLRALRQRP